MIPKTKEKLGKEYGKCKKGLVNRFPPKAGLD